jgi:hypothetical protein
MERLAPLLADAARLARYAAADMRYADETYVRSTVCGATSTGVKPDLRAAAVFIEPDQVI